MRNFLVIFFIITMVVSASGRIIRIPYNGPTIQDGIDGARDGDLVVVAPGTYTGHGNRDIDFSGKAILLISEEGPEATVIDCEGTDEEPHRGFYFHCGERDDSIVEGFTVTGGYTSGEEWIEKKGAAILCLNSSPCIRECTIESNYSRSGGIIDLNYSTESLISRCIIIDNTVEESGGGINCMWSSPSIANCIISRNTINSVGGGVICYGSSPELKNCIITQNVTVHGGGVYCHTASSPSLINSTIFANISFRGDWSGIGCFDLSSPTIHNCILWNDCQDELYVESGEPSVEYSNVRGGWPGTGNIDSDPLFRSYKRFDYLLSRESPCIDAGDTSIEDGCRWPEWYDNYMRSDMGAYGGPKNIRWIR